MGSQWHSWSNSMPFATLPCLLRTKRRKGWETDQQILWHWPKALCFKYLFIQPLLSGESAQESRDWSLTHQGLSYPSHRSWCPWIAPCLYTDTPCWRAAWRQLLQRCVPCFEAHRFDIAEPIAAPRSCNPLHPQPWCPAGRGWSLSPSLLFGRQCRHQLWPGSPLQQWLHVETVKRKNTNQATSDQENILTFLFASMQTQTISFSDVLHFAIYFPTY